MQPTLTAPVYQPNGCAQVLEIVSEQIHVQLSREIPGHPARGLAVLRPERPRSSLADSANQTSLLFRECSWPHRGQRIGKLSRPSSIPEVCRLEADRGALPIFCSGHERILQNLPQDR
jgi:hypothetical protein